MLSFLPPLARALGFPWGFMVLLIGLGALALLLAWAVKWGGLWASFILISLQRRWYLAPSQIQYGVEHMLVQTPILVRKALRIVAISYFVWLLLYVAQGYLYFHHLKQFVAVMTSQIELLFDWLCARLA